MCSRVSLSFLKTVPFTDVAVFVSSLKWNLRLDRLSLTNKHENPKAYLPFSNVLPLLLSPLFKVERAFGLWQQQSELCSNLCSISRTLVLETINSPEKTPSTTSLREHLAFQRTQDKAILRRWSSRKREVKEKGGERFNRKKKFNFWLINWVFKQNSRILFWKHKHFLPLQLSIDVKS